MNKIFVAIFFVLFTFTYSNAEILVKADEDGKLQANLQNVSLEEVKTFFEKNYQIKIKGDDNLFQTQLTVSFNKLSLEKTLKRIFSKMNVVFSYNSQGKITEVRLLPTGQNQFRAAIANDAQQLPVEQTQDSLQLNNLDQNDLQSSDEITAFQVEPDSPPLGDSPPVDSNDEITTFQVEVNSPPSGDSFQIVPSAPPSSN